MTRINTNIKVNVYGLGYIGLPTAAVIAKFKIPVLGIDINQKVIETINSGKIHIIEPDLEGLVKTVVERELLSASNKPLGADVHIIAVPTPFQKNFEPDISFVENAIHSVISVLEPGNLVIIESTSPVGTTEKMKELIYTERKDLINEIFIAYCPERVLPGNVIYELENNDRVIGGINNESSESAIQFYRHFVKGELHKTNAQTAEMCKLVENASRDVQIAFANELSLIADEANINVWELIELANKHPRVKILQPGTGVGGHCIAVDPWFIIANFKKNARIISMARQINTHKTEWVIGRTIEEINKFKNENNRLPKIGIMGLAFKPNIDDLRESPALHVANTLQELYKDNIFVSEPNIHSSKTFTILTPDEISRQADILVFLVGHREFKLLEIGDVKTVLDFCGIRNK